MKTIRIQNVMAITSVQHVRFIEDLKMIEGSTIDYDKSDMRISYPIKYGSPLKYIRWCCFLHDIKLTRVGKSEYFAVGLI